MRLVLVCVSGALFATGLAIGGMTQPSKVVGFLDVTGRWDPSLLLVMAGATLVYAAAYRWVRRHRPRPFHALRFQVPDRRDIDGPLVAGAALFGVGWGLGGFCPGPGLVAAAALSPQALVFVAAMLAGFALHAWARPTRI